MTDRNNHTLVTVIIILAIIVCVFLLIRYPPGFSAYSPASAASFSTYTTNPNQNNYSGSFSAYPYNQYGGAAYPAYNQATTYPTTTYTTYPVTTTYPVVISNFNDCVNAGYPILQTYPEQCRTPDGHTFTQASTRTTTTQTQYQYQYTNPID